MLVHPPRPKSPLLRALTRTKSIDELQADAGRRGEFRRVLGLWQLTGIGLGGLIGAGIFVLTGVVAATQAGPGVSLSFVIAGVASAAAALCYAEFAGMIPVAGSAYTYGYAALGEIVAWIIGWDLLLEYSLVVAVVSIGWSGYLQALFGGIGLPLPLWARGAAATGPGHVIDLAAMLGSLAIAGLLTLRIEWGARFNTAMVLLKLAAVVLVIAAGLPYVQPANWHPFMPYGFKGVAEGAAVVFFAVFGYDTLTTAAEEARDPQRQLPLAVVLSLGISLALYIAGFGADGPRALRHAQQRRSRCGRVYRDRPAVGYIHCFCGSGCWHCKRDACVPARLRPHMVCDEPRRFAPRLVCAGPSALQDAAPANAHRRFFDCARRWFLPDQGGGGTRQYWNALRFRHHLLRSACSAADQAKCPADFPHPVRAMDPAVWDWLLDLALIETSSACLAPFRNLDGTRPIDLLLLWSPA